MNIRPAITIFTVLTLSLAMTFFLKLTPVFAQEVSSGISFYIDISDKNVKPGEIISFSNQNYHMTRVPYDPTAFAVVTANPAVAVVNQNATNASYAVVSTGRVYVLVSTKNGKIKPGDLITPSDIPGVGMKSTQDGFVIGTAVDSYDAADPTKVTAILVSLNFGYFTDTMNSKANLLLTMRQAVSSAYMSPSSVIRYVLSAFIIIVSFGFGIGYFGRILTTGVEALGRNPLASRLIMVTIVLNLFLLLATLSAGIVVAYFVIAF